MNAQRHTQCTVDPTHVSAAHARRLRMRRRDCTPSHVTPRTISAHTTRCAQKTQAFRVERLAGLSCLCARTRQGNTSRTWCCATGPVSLVLRAAWWAFGQVSCGLQQFFAAVFLCSAQPSGLKYGSFSWCVASENSAARCINGAWCCSTDISGKPLSSYRCPELVMSEDTAAVRTAANGHGNASNFHMFLSASLTFWRWVCVCQCVNLPARSLSLIRGGWAVQGMDHRLSVLTFPKEKLKGPRSVQSGRANMPELLRFAAAVSRPTPFGTRSRHRTAGMTCADVTRRQFAGHCVWQPHTKVRLDKGGHGF